MKGTKQGGLEFRSLFVVIALESSLDVFRVNLYICRKGWLVQNMSYGPCSADYNVTVNFRILLVDLSF